MSFPSAPLGVVDCVAIPYILVQACTSGGCGQSNSSSLKTLQAMPTFQAAPTVTALNAVTALSNPNSLLIHLQCVSCFCPSHNLQCPVIHNLQPSTQYSFVEAACTTAAGGVTNVTTLDSAPVGQAPPSSSIPLPLPCPSNGMLPSNLTMSITACITAYTLHHRVSSLKSQSEMWAPPSTATAQFHTYNPSGILFYQINSVMTDFLGVKPHGGLPWLIFDVGSGPAVVGSNSTRTFNDGQWHTSPPVGSNLFDGQGHVVLFEQASNTFYITVDTVHMVTITAMNVPLLTTKVYFEGFPSMSSRYGIATPYSMCLIPS
eukprot:Em0004g1464a